MGARANAALNFWGETFCIMTLFYRNVSSAAQISFASFSKSSIHNPASTTSTVL